MKISELKQPYKRMAEYLAEKNTYTRFKNKEILNDAFDWYETNVNFWSDIADGYYPPITEEIKQHFPPDFDFSGEEEVVNTNPFSFDGLSLNEISIRIFRKNFMDLELWEQSSVSEKFEKALHGVNLHKELFDAVNVPKEIKEYKMSLFDKENQRKIEDENLQKRIYTQLAKEGKFEQLPDTCEFSEPVELEVCDGGTINQIAKVIGKFKGRFVEKEDISRNG